MSSANLAPTAIPLPARALSRRWKPSLTDLFFFAVIFTLFLSSAGGWDRLVWDGDTGLHTRTGDWILDNGAVPRTDPFSFTMPGERWFAYEWLTQVLFALLNRWMGLKGIVLVSGIVIAAVSVVLLRQALRRGANGLVAMVLVLVAGNAMSIHYHARPHIVTLLLLPIALDWIYRDMKSPSRRVWWILPLTLAWVNMHSAFPVLLAALGLTVIGAAIPAVLRRQSWRPAGRYALLLAGCSALTFVNPNGFALHAHILEVVNNPWVLEHVHEFQPPTFNSEAMYYFLGILALAAASAVPMLRRGEWTAVLWMAAFGVGSLISVRHVPVFVAVATPFVAVEASRLLDWVAARQGSRSIVGVLAEVAGKLTERLQPVSVWSAAIVLGVAVFSSTFPADLSAKFFPRAMVSKHTAELASNRVYTSDQWGDYLLWRNYPAQRTFIDGRSDYFQAAVGDPYIIVQSGLAGWQEILDKHSVTLLLVPTEDGLARVLPDAPAWELVDQDKQALLYRRR